MQPHNDEPGPGRPAPADAAQDAANAVHLGLGEWLAAGAIVLAVLLAVPELWKAVEPPPAAADFRLPYELSDDYWLFARHCRAAAAAERTLVLGDSVVWGHYVAAGETLSGALNELAGTACFANAGVDGIHPAALAGLVEHYGGCISGRDVLLHCNLLWMSSERHDLSIERPVSFNHPELVAQFAPRIPCYGATVADRLSVAVRREAGLFAWTKHLRLACLGNMDLPAWTVEPGRARANPVAAILAAARSERAAASPETDPRPWEQAGIGRYAPAWVELDDSLQWRFFRRTIERLRERNNRVFVVVGPFNEHMLEAESLSAYRRRVEGVRAWLRRQRIPHCACEALPSGEYADASHPLARGYAILARRIWEHEAFARFDGRRRAEANAKGNPR